MQSDSLESCVRSRIAFFEQQFLKNSNSQCSREPLSDTQEQQLKLKRKRDSEDGRLTPPLVMSVIKKFATPEMDTKITKTGAPLTALIESSPGLVKDRIEMLGRISANHAFPNHAFPHDKRRKIESNSYSELEIREAQDGVKMLEPSPSSSSSETASETAVAYNQSQLEKEMTNESFTKLADCLEAHYPQSQTSVQADVLSCEDTQADLLSCQDAEKSPAALSRVCCESSPASGTPPTTRNATSSAGSEGGCFYLTRSQVPATRSGKKRRYEIAD